MHEHIVHTSSLADQVWFCDSQEHFELQNKNSAEVDIAPAFGEITTACNVGQAKRLTLLQRNDLYF